MTAPHPIRVLVVDDSALARRVIVRALESDPGIVVIGTASEPRAARDLVVLDPPDVITLDVEMPGMDGLEFLRRLMAYRPIPVVMVSSLTRKGTDVALDALGLGAVDVVAKPTSDVAHGLTGLRDELVAKVRAAAGARPRPRSSTQAVTRNFRRARGGYRTTQRVIGIGASTGGTEAILQILAELPPDAPGVVVVQHMPPGFTQSFAERCDAASRLQVREAKDGDRVVDGIALIAPGNRHLRIERHGAGYRVRLSDDERVNHHRPSVDVMFRSLAAQVGTAGVGVILTGMGADGAAGLLEVRRAGAPTVAQDEASCVVFGMPREAIRLESAAHVLPLDDIASAIMRFVA